MAKYSDILIHECTLENGFEEKAINNGHSTPSNLTIIFDIIYFKVKFLKIGIATDVANKTQSKTLILNHFSQRYKPVNYFDEKKESNLISNDGNEEEILDNVQKLIDEAKQSFNGPVIASYDFYIHKV